MKSISTDQFFLKDVFAEGWRVTKAIFAKCVPVVIAFGFLVYFGAQTAINRMGLDALDASGQIPLRNQMAMLMIHVAFYCLIFSVAILTIVKLAERAVTRRDISRAEALAEGFRRWPRLIWTGFIWAGTILGLTIFSGVLMQIPHDVKWVASTIALVQFGIMIATVLWILYNLFAPYVVAVTSLYGSRALDYSEGLVKRGRLRTACYFFVMGLASYMLSRVLASIGQDVIGAVAPHLPQPVVIPFSSLILSVSLLPEILQLSLGTVFFLNTAYLNRRE